MKVERGPNSKAPATIIKDPQKEAIKKALSTDYKLPMTDSETLAVAVENIGDEKIAKHLKEMTTAVESIKTLQTAVRGDLTRSDTEKLRVLSSRTEKTFNALSKSYAEISKEAFNHADASKSKLFSSNTTLTDMEQRMLPILANSLSNEEFELSASNATESEGKVLLHLLKTFPSLVHKDHNLTLKDTRTDLNQRFTPDELKTMQDAYFVAQTVREFIPKLTNAKESILPSDILSHINGTRVA